VDYIQESVELMRIIFLLGAVFALLYKKKIGVTPGGIIVPGLLACIMVASFKAFLLTILNACICWAIYRISFAHIALSKRTTSLSLIGLSVFFGIGESLLIGHSVGISHELLLASLVVPGLIVIGATKYGISRVAMGVSVTTAGTLASGLILAKLISVSITSYLSTGLGSYSELELKNPALSLALSLVVAAVLYAVFKVRSGGYLMAPYLATLIFISPVQSLMLFVGIIASYFAVNFILKNSLIIGLERFVVSLFCGYFVVSLSDYIAIVSGLETYYISTLTTIIAVAVITNDMTLQPFKKAVGKGITPAIVASYLVRAVV